MDFEFTDRGLGNARLRIESSDLRIVLDLDESEVDSLREAIGGTTDDLTDEISALRHAVESARNGMCSAKDDIERALSNANEELESAESRFDDLMSDIENALEQLPES